MSPQRTHGERIEIIETEIKQARKEIDQSHNDYCELKELATQTNTSVIKLELFLLGDDFDRELNGGFVKFIKKLALDVKDLKRRREWLKGAWWASGGILGVIGTILIINWDKIFG